LDIPVSKQRSVSAMLLAINTISQGHLNVWTTCRRKFQHLFLDELSLPTASDIQSKLDLGTKFHLLIQQKELGLDVADVAASEANLEKWLLAFETNPPITIAGDRLSEHRRTCELRVGDCDYLLNAIYDLLIVGSGGTHPAREAFPLEIGNRTSTTTPAAQIIDWKTHQRPLSFVQLQANWQTRLYLYILAKTTNFAPEQLSTIYWFANTATAVTINYDRAQHQKTDRDLAEILSQISQSQLEERFEQIPLGSEECTRCDFAHRCRRVSEVDNLEVWLERSLDDYPEVAINN
jgi:PD-(D/E)XK nuclease superfamily